MHSAEQVFSFAESFPVPHLVDFLAGRRHLQSPCASQGPRYAHRIPRAIVEALRSPIADQLITRVAQRETHTLRSAVSHYEAGPDVTRLALTECARMLGLPVPQLLVVPHYEGILRVAEVDESYCILMSKRLPDALQLNELHFALGVACGHISNKHVKYLAAQRLLRRQSASPVLAALGGGAVWGSLVVLGRRAAATRLQERARQVRTQVEQGLREVGKAAVTRLEQGLHVSGPD